MKNKRGLIQFIIFGIILVFVLIFLGLFIFSSTFRWTLIGIGFIVMSFIILGAGWIKHQNTKIITFIVLIGSGLILIFSSGALQSVISTSTFVNPDWARLECSPTDGYEGIQTYNPPSNGQEITCGINENTDECRLTISNQGGGWFSGGTVSFYLNGGQQTIKSGGSPLIINMKAGDKITYSYLTLGSSDKVKIVKEWKPYQLYRFVGGAKWIVNSVNCDIQTSILGNILNSDYTGSRLYKSGGEGTKWINYVNAWNYGPATNVFTHPSYGEVYCNAGQIFSIVKLQMKDGSLKRLNPSYSETTPSGDTISGMGSKLASVQCCPNEPNCGNDFKYKETQPSCFTDIQCTNAGGPIPITQTTYVKYQCINEKCTKSSPISVECTTSAGCSNGQICDLSTTNYGKCITQIGQDYCGDGKCSITENSQICSADCRLDNRCGGWYQEPYQKDVKDWAWYNYLTLGVIPPSTHSESGCKTAGWIYLTAIILLIGGLGAFAVYRITGKKRR